jgi:hypothetical protein
MLLAISIGGLVLLGCGSTVMTFLTIWSREGKHDLSREKEYSTIRALTQEIIKAIFDSPDCLDFKS